METSQISYNDTLHPYVCTLLR